MLKWFENHDSLSWKKSLNGEKIHADSSVVQQCIYNVLMFVNYSNFVKFNAQLKGFGDVDKPFWSLHLLY